MITHHPKQELIQAFVTGVLPVSLSVGVAAHIEMCEQCKSLAADLTEQAANSVFELSTSSLVEAPEDTDLMEMLEGITEDDSLDELSVLEPPCITVDERKITLPRVFNQLPLKGWSKLGDVSRARIELEEEPLRSSLLNIAPNGGVPMHTHKGFELTLILEGSFSDDLGEYMAGDFIWLNHEHTHSPVTSEGCLCYTVSDGAQKFTQGLSQLLNPIGNFLY